MSALAASVVLFAETAGEAKSLETTDLLLYLGGIAALVFVVVLAGLGYFTPGSGDDKH